MVWKICFVIGEAYLLGSIPFGYLLYRMRRGGDVRTTGSGNIGATNVLRGAGIAAGSATLLLDAGKGYLAVAIAAALTARSPDWMSAAAVFAIIGHIFPVFLKFRGGKGVATGLGSFLALAPLPALGAVCVFMVVTAIWRYVSLASIAAVSVFPLILLIQRGWSAAFPASLVCAVLIAWRHRTNIQRLRMGTENRIRGRRELTGNGAVRR